MGFDGLISASSSGSSQNILLQDLYIVFQNALFVSTVHGSYPPTPPLNQCYQGPYDPTTATFARTSKKKIGFECQNKNFALAAHFFVHYFTLTARLRHENALFAKTKRDLFFSF